MDLLKKKLKELREKKENLSLVLCGLGVDVKKKKAAKKNRSSKKKINIIRRELPLEKLKNFARGEEELKKIHSCNATGCMMYSSACIIRVFGPDNRGHNKCRKCRKFDSYIDKLLEEIKNEK